MCWQEKSGPVPQNYLGSCRHRSTRRRMHRGHSGHQNRRLPRTKDGKTTQREDSGEHDLSIMKGTFPESNNFCGRFLGSPGLTLRPLVEGPPARCRSGAKRALPSLVCRAVCFFSSLGQPKSRWWRLAVPHALTRSPVFPDLRSRCRSSLPDLSSVIRLGLRFMPTAA